MLSLCWKHVVLRGLYSTLYNTQHRPPVCLVRLSKLLFIDISLNIFGTVNDVNNGGLSVVRSQNDGKRQLAGEPCGTKEHCATGCMLVGTFSCCNNMQPDTHSV